MKRIVTLAIMAAAFITLLPLTVCAQIFTGTNNPGEYKDYSFHVGQGETALRLSVAKDGNVGSYIQLKYGGLPSGNSDYQYSSRVDGSDNLLDLDQTALKEGTWFVRVLTPATAAGPHSFTLVENTGAAARPLSEPVAFTKVSGTLAAGADSFYRIDLPQDPQGWRIVLSSSAASSITVRSGYPTDGTAVASSSYNTLHTLLISPDNLTGGGTYYLQVHADSAMSYQLTSDPVYVRTLGWDPGTAPAGSNIISAVDGGTGSNNVDTAGGDYLFRVTTQTAVSGAWRSALKVTGGEADIYLQQDTPPTSGWGYKSNNNGDDGIILAASQFGDNQSWYIRVHASAGAEWQLYSGDIYVYDIPQVTDAPGVPAGAAADGSVTIGPEGMVFFRTSVDADTQGWRLWLKGATLPIFVKKSAAPVASSQSYHDQYEDGQMLLVPPYLTNAAYFVGVAGASGTKVTLDSRKQLIRTPTAEAGFSGPDNFFFSLPGNVNNDCGYLTYRVEVPVQQIAWQVNLAPGSSLQNPEVYIRKGAVPNRWQNDALSEAPAGVTDSVTQVPPALTDGAWYVTVYGTGNFNFTLTSGNPVVTGISYINDANLYSPAGSTTYNPATLYPALCPNAETAWACKAEPVGYDAPDHSNTQFANQSGWRYYQVSDIDSQLGFLGWQLDLDQASQGRKLEIALRRNAVPARWHYRNGGSIYYPSTTQGLAVDLSSDYGFLQQPNHQADIWYVGVNAGDQALGVYQLTTRDIAADQLPTADGSDACRNDPAACANAVSVSDQPANSWRFFKVTIPEQTDPQNPMLGWDLRLVNVTNGTPRLVVRRDQLPGVVSTTYDQAPDGSLGPVFNLKKWPSGFQWANGKDWSGRSYNMGPPAWVRDSSSYFVMGMGSPLEPGTYYVGVTGPDTMSYLLQSRGIGIGKDPTGAPWPIQVKDLGFAASQTHPISDTDPGLAPREADYYRVKVPAGARSWSLNMQPAVGEALIAVGKEALPNVESSINTSDGVFIAGARHQKPGQEFFYKYPSDDAGALAAADTYYYVAVISEGANAPGSEVIGSGGVSYTITSVGEMPMSDKTGEVLAAPTATDPGRAVRWSGESLWSGQQKVYRFRVPEGLASLEVRLKNRTGAPEMTMRSDATGAGNLPYVSNQGVYHASEGGWYSPALWRNPELITLPQPSAGDYTLVVEAVTSWESGVGMQYSDASYDIEVIASNPEPLSFARGSSTVAGQAPNSWRYFMVEVPQVDPANPLLGWDLRLVNVTGGTPNIVVRSGQLPGDFTPSSGYDPSGDYGAIYDRKAWPYGWQWPSGNDWTGRWYNSGAPQWSPDRGKYLVMGMGSPLVPGTYYVGVSGSDTMSYTLQSRGIGMGKDAKGVAWPIQVKELDFVGSQTHAINDIDPGLAPREADFYRVKVPAGARSWSLDVKPSVGEALMAVRKEALPNVAAGISNPSDSPFYITGTKRQKPGQEFFYKYPRYESRTIAETDTYYYVAVISEGVDPGRTDVIGSGRVSYTITSAGEMPVSDKTAEVLAAATATTPASPVRWSGEPLANGQQKAYRFRVPEGLASMELRLKNRVGNPHMSLRGDAADDGAIPEVNEDSSYIAAEGGLPLDRHDEALITIPQPAAGDYTLVVSARAVWDSVNGWQYPDASFDIEVSAKDPDPVRFIQGRSTVTGQLPNTWRYFKIEVPVVTDPANPLLGWDLRLVDVTGGTPNIVVRRGQLPGDFTTSWGYDPSGYNLPIYYHSTWPSGWQWPNGNDWTGRWYNSGEPEWSPDGGKYLVMGMGSPLVPDTYYVGVSGSDTMSYTLQSRGIGIGKDADGVPWPIQVKELDFVGSQTHPINDTDPGLAPREADFYRVKVPAGARSWSLDVKPSVGEALMAVRKEALPNVQADGFSNPSDSPSYMAGAKRQKAGQEFFYKYPRDDSRTIAATDTYYYVAVISEGVDPERSYVIGSGGVSYTITSVGEMPVSDKTAQVLSAATATAPGSPVTWSGESLAGGQQKAYRFRVPEGVTSVEVRLKNRVGNPHMSLRGDAADGGAIPEVSEVNAYIAAEGGLPMAYGDDALISIPQPAAGDYTLVVNAATVWDSVAGWQFPNASYDVAVSAQAPQSLAASDSSAACLSDPANCANSASGSLVDQQTTHYRVVIPQEVNSYPVVGWTLRASSTNGNATIRVSKDQVPADQTGILSSNKPMTTIVPPFLTPGTWYVEVKGNQLTDYTLKSELITAEPAATDSSASGYPLAPHHRRSWAMPARTGSIASCSDANGTPVIAAPYFGDSGLTAPDPAKQGACSEIKNPSTGDLGTDLANGEYHYYRISVPDGNAGLLRTVVEALSGQPELYLRKDYPPSTDHKNSTDPNDGYAQYAFDRSQIVHNTMYGNWVPIDGRIESQLPAGEWWLAVRASGSNIRYRLKVAAGDVRNDAGALQDKQGYLQDLELKGGVKTRQAVAAGDMIFYKVSVPQSSTDPAASAPLNWTLNLQQQVGDVAIFIRDSIPPGIGEGGDMNNTFWDIRTGSTLFRDWYDDNDGGRYSSTPYIMIDDPGTTTLSMPPLKPGKTYYLGVYGKTDASFDLSSSTGSETLKLEGVIPFYGGSVANRVLAPGESVIYRIYAPADAVRWRHSALHDPGVQLFLMQDTVPQQDQSLAPWSSNYCGNNSCGWQANSSFSKYLYESTNNYPWQPDHNYYLVAANTTMSSQPLSLTMDGRNRDTDDENLNRIPDWWERQYFGYLTWYQGDDDPDGDGLTLLQDYQLGVDPTRPALLASTITSPADQATVAGAVTITGTATIGSYSTISRVEVSTDGGSNWSAATDTSGNGSWSSWSFHWTPDTVNRQFSIKSRAVAAAGNSEAAGTGIRVTDSRFYTLTTEATSGGSLTGATGTFFLGTVASLAATPLQCYSFTGWSGDAAGSENPLNVVMDRDRKITASFAAKGAQQLTVRVNMAEGGSVDRQSGAIPCGQSVQITATPAPGYRFTGWSGDVAGASQQLTVTLTQPVTVTANFESINRPVDGACGPASGATFASQPAENLCASGAASTVSGTGPWSWSCDGAYGGASVACSAAKLQKAGDCDGNGTVSIAEVQTAINMFLGLKIPAACVDLNSSDSVEIAEVQKAINAYLGL